MILVAVFLIGIALLGLFFGGWLWGLSILILILIGMYLYWVLPRAYIRVPEKEVAVVYNTSSKSFSRFLGAGGHWLAPGLHVVKSFISTSPRVETASCKVRTVGGITLIANWRVTYIVDPLLVAPELRTNMARTLAHNPQDLVLTNTSNLIQHIFEHHTIEELCSPGIQSRLETRLTRILRDRLSRFGIGVKRLILLEMILPERVQAAIEAAYERRLQAEAEAQALAIRQQAIRAFSQEDIRRQLELEQLRVLETKPGDAVMVMGARSYHPQIKHQPPDPLQVWRLAEDASV